MNDKQFNSVKIAYTQCSNTLQELLDQKDTPRAIIFELSATVGMLRTLIQRHINENKPHAHLTNQRLKVSAQGRLRQGHPSHH